MRSTIPFAGVLVVALGLAVSTASAAARPGPLDIGSDRAERAIVTATPAFPESRPIDTAMLRALAGVLADYRAGDLAKLRACLDPTARSSPAANWAELEPICIIHLSARASTVSKRVEVRRREDGEFLLAEIEPQPSAGSASPAKRPAAPPATPLSRDRFQTLAAAWPMYRGSFDAPNPDEPAPAADAIPRGAVIELPRPYIPAWFTLDKKTLGERFLAGRKTTIEGSVRDLSREKFLARLPRAYDPRHPAGLIVWIDAASAGSPPPELAPVADELGLVIIGAAESGNNRPAPERYQLALDAAATASARFHIDPRRVYVAGISGGGRVASILWACFPDVFPGGLGVVGLSHYMRVPSGLGSYYEAAYERPPIKLFELLQSPGHRLAGITGTKEMNYLEIMGTQRQMAKDGLDVRAFEYPGMAHEMATPERCAEAVGWLDEPYRAVRAKEEDSARALLKAYIDAQGDRPAQTDAQRAALAKITDAGPWTDAAWKAVQLLK
jgi:hypothetical protein